MRHSNFLHTSGVWACYGINKKKPSGWECLNVGQCKRIGIEMRNDLKYSRGRFSHKQGEYRQSEPMTGICKNIMSEIARVHWATGAHSAGYVPVYAVGAGAERFAARTDNAQLPIKIAEAAGYKH